jgi:hypothetical protein
MGIVSWFEQSWYQVWGKFVLRMQSSIWSRFMWNISLPLGRTSYILWKNDNLKFWAHSISMHIIKQIVS